MPTALTSLANLQTLFGISAADSPNNNVLQILLAEASQFITNYCHRRDFGLQQYTRVLSGNNVPELVLPDVPVQGAILAGTTTSGSNVITAIPITGSPNAQNLFLYQSVMGPGIPQNAVITDISSAASGQISIGTVISGVVANANCTASATVNLNFGIALWQDDNAYAGSAYGSFALGTLLTEGVDYFLDWDGAGYGNYSSSGIVYNIDGYWYRPGMWTYGLITTQPGPPIKNCMAQYLAGYVTIPADLNLACEQLCARMRNTRKFGIGVQSLSNDMSVSFSSPPSIWLGLITPEVASVLAKYAMAAINSA